jgi:multidrug efflux system outer membrane protein
MIYRRSCAVLLLIFPLVAACAIGPDFEEPVMETPESFANDSFDSLEIDPRIEIAWWELFEDPVLGALIDSALTANRSVLVAASRIEEARAALGFTKADLYPSITLQGSASRGNLAGTSKMEEVYENYFLAPVLSWEIDFWGKYRRAGEAAAAELMASEYSLRSVQISIVAEVARTYFLLLDYMNRLEISKRTLESRKYSLNIIEQRFEKGIIPELNVNQAQIQLEIAAGAIPIHERLVIETKNALSLLLGRPPMDVLSAGDISESTFPPDIPPGLPSGLLERRPDIMQARYAAQAQNARIGVAQAMRLPAISLTGLFGWASDDLATFTTGENAWSVSGGLLGPVFEFGKNSRRVDVERERALQAVLRYEETVLQAFREVEDALVGVSTYREQLGAVRRKLDAARNAARLSAERYDKGFTSYLEVLETERTLFSVELEMSELMQTYLNSYVRLYKSLGGGWGSADNDHGQDEKEDADS